VPGANGLIGSQVPDKPGETMAAFWDRFFLDWSNFGLGNHLWASAKTWDPEGVLSTAGAVGTCMLGNLTGRWIGQPRPLLERLAGMFAVGSLAMVVGLMWNWVFPINKGIWTSSYVLFTAGMAVLALATVMWLVDVRQWKGWIKPFVIYGTNPMIAFLFSGLMARLIYSMIKVPYEGRTVSLQSAIYQSAFASWLSPLNASLAFAISFVLFWYVILLLLYRRNIVFKV
jgi:predicted acyltransferase